MISGFVLASGLIASSCTTGKRGETGKPVSWEFENKGAKEEGEIIVFTRIRARACKDTYTAVVH